MELTDRELKLIEAMCKELLKDVRNVHLLEELTDLRQKIKDEQLTRAFIH